MQCLFYNECVGPPGCELADSPTEVPSAAVWMRVLQPDLELGGGREQVLARISSHGCHLWA